MVRFPDSNSHGSGSHTHYGTLKVEHTVRHAESCWHEGVQDGHTLHLVERAPAPSGQTTGQASNQTGQSM